MHWATVHLWSPVAHELSCSQGVRGLDLAECSSKPSPDRHFEPRGREHCACRPPSENRTTQTQTLTHTRARGEMVFLTPKEGFWHLLPVRFSFVLENNHNQIDWPLRTTAQRDCVFLFLFSVKKERTQNKVSSVSVSRAAYTVKLQIFVRYPFSYFWLETGSYELIFVLSRASKQNYIEIRWPQDKNKFSSGIKFRTFFKSTKVRN